MPATPWRVTVRHLQHSIHWASDKICRTLSVRRTFSILFPSYHGPSPSQPPRPAFPTILHLFTGKYETQAPEHRQASEAVRTPSEQTSRVLQVRSDTLTTEQVRVCGKNRPEQDQTTTVDSLITHTPFGAHRSRAIRGSPFS